MIVAKELTTVAIIITVSNSFPFADVEPLLVGTPLDLFRLHLGNQTFDLHLDYTSLQGIRSHIGMRIRGARPAISARSAKQPNLRLPRWTDTAVASPAFVLICGQLFISQFLNALSGSICSHLLTIKATVRI